MEMITTNTTDRCPEGVYIGISEIQTQLNQDGLSPDEKQEFNSFSNEKRKAEYISVRKLFRFVAEQMRLDANLIQLKKEESGKPYAELEGMKINVSFSHSSDLVFCAISKELNIGLDAEPLNREVDERLINRILNEKERPLLSSVEPIKLWTIKEATVKCLGTGLRTNLKDITITENQKKRFSVRFNDDICFEICSFSQSNHQLALAYQI